jgi:hypothetical protein
MLVNSLWLCENAHVVGSLALKFLKPRPNRRGFLLWRPAMQPANQPTKQDERALLRELAEQRQSQTPEHHDPAWMTMFWKRVAS